MEGVMSGDPGPRAITPWTRVADAEGAGTVELQVARDRGFRRVVARELVRTSKRAAHSVKGAGWRPARARGVLVSILHRGAESKVGRFRTAPPPDSRKPARFAFFSCQDYGFGYRAYFESMPTFGAKRGTNRIYRSLRFGRTVELILLDQRQYRADQPCGDAQLGPSATS
jgi:phosphodiesterase/alkaline phosphatase D-like protein